MIGPIVNQKVLLDMKKEREEAGLNNLLNNLVNIGSCNLHVVHGKLKSTTEATKWNLRGAAFQVGTNILGRAGRKCLTKSLESG